MKRGSMKTAKRDFDLEAGSWDEKPERVKMAQDVARSIQEAIRLNDGMEVMDFGCGTGLLTLQIQPFARFVTGVDSSSGMLEVLREKIEKQKLSNVKAQFLDLEGGDTLDGAYDLIVSNMTLHHVRDVGTLLAQFHRVLKSGGSLALADLDQEGGRFHGDNTGVFHFGFDRSALKKEYEKAGFVEIRDRTAAEVVKTAPDGGKNKFSIFLVTGKK
jgi:ubiquinone/menaquinone biosynthesis C-methylase UbiE